MPGEMLVSSGQEQDKGSLNQDWGARRLLKVGKGERWQKPLVSLKKNKSLL